MRKIAVVLASFVALMLGATGAQAITWGTPDTGEYPHVVTLLFKQGGVDYYSCSGTLLSPTLVLTAGHCTEGGGQVNDETWVSNDPDPLHDDDGTDEYFENSGHWVSGEAIPHDDYADFAEFPDTYDIGVVVLDEAIDVEEYGVLPELGFLTEVNTAKGSPKKRQVTVVGYGLQGTIPAFEQDDYERYVGTATIMGVDKSSWQGSQSVQLSNSPGAGTGSGGTCFGDSGGPAFWINPNTGETTNIVVAITSFGFTGQCAGTDMSFRTDIKVAKDFVEEHLN